MQNLFVDARKCAEGTEDLEKARELLQLIHHHSSIDTNLQYLEPQPGGIHESEQERLNKIEVDVNEHKAEVRRLL